MNKEQFDLLYHMILDSLVRVTAIENLMMRKNLATDEEIQNEIVSISAGVIASASAILADADLTLPEINVMQDAVVELIPAGKKKDHNTN